WIDCQQLADTYDIIPRGSIKDALRVESEPVNTQGGIRDQPDDSRLTIRRVDGQQSAWGVSGSSGNTIKSTCAIKRNAAQAIETSVPDKGCALFGDVNQLESPTASGIIAAGRAIKECPASSC